jgi:hypothetical protein
MSDRKYRFDVSTKSEEAISLEIRLAPATPTLPRNAGTSGVPGFPSATLNYLPRRTLNTRIAEALITSALNAHIQREGLDENFLAMGDLDFVINTKSGDTRNTELDSCVIRMVRGETRPNRETS